jgi:hypothetical protein
MSSNHRDAMPDPHKNLLGSGNLDDGRLLGVGAALLILGPAIRSAGMASEEAPVRTGAEASVSEMSRVNDSRADIQGFQDPLRAALTLIEKGTTGTDLLETVVAACGLEPYQSGSSLYSLRDYIVSLLSDRDEDEAALLEVAGAALRQVLALALRRRHAERRNARADALVETLVRSLDATWVIDPSSLAAAVAQLDPDALGQAEREVAHLAQFSREEQSAAIAVKEATTQGDWSHVALAADRARQAKQRRDGATDALRRLLATPDATTTPSASDPPEGLGAVPSENHTAAPASPTRSALPQDFQLPHAQSDAALPVDASTSDVPPRDLSTGEGLFPEVPSSHIDLPPTELTAPTGGSSESAQSVYTTVQGRTAPDLGHDSVSRVVVAASQALTEDQPGLAYHILTAAQDSSGSTALLASALQLHMAARVADGASAADERMRDAIAAALDTWQSDGIEPVVGAGAGLLLLQAGILLALLVPGANERALLAVLSQPTAAQATSAILAALPAHRAMALAMLDAMEKTGSAALLRPELLAEVISQEEWQAALRRHQSDVQEWLDQEARGSTLNFARATNLWRSWVRPQGLIWSLLEPVQQDDRNRAGWLDEHLAKLDVDREVHATDRLMHISSAKRKPIEARALDQIRGKARHAEGLARAWLNHLKNLPTQPGSFRRDAAARLRAALQSQLEPAEQEITALARHGGAESAVSGMARDCLGRLRTLLQGRMPRPDAASSDALRNRELVALAMVRLAPDWRIVGADSTARYLVDLMTLRHFDPAKAARMRLEREHLVEAALAIGLVRTAQGAEAAELSDIEPDLRKAVQRAAEDARTRRQTTLTRLRSDVEAADRDGRIETGEAQGVLEELRFAQQQLGETVNVAGLEVPSTLDDVDRTIARAGDTIATARERAHRRIKQRLDTARGAHADGAAERVRHEIEAGRLAIAEDFLERIEAGETLPERVPASTAPECFDRFFPDRAETIANWLGGQHGGLDALRIQAARGTIPPSLAGDGPIGEPARAAELVDRWTTVARGPSSDLSQSLSLLLQGLGLANPRLPNFKAPAQRHSEAFFTIEANPLRDRETVPVPQFGSAAHGHYGLLCLWRSRDPDAIVQALARRPAGDGPVLVLFFGVLGRDKRYQLAEQARQGRLSRALVIDDVLITYLAITRDSRLATLFACTLPFTDSQPWIATGTPAPEMFYGRRRELDAVKAIEGEFTHLIYGGRQLGKTALLRQAERELQSDTVVVRYISVQQIGTIHPCERLWDELYDRLIEGPGALRLPKQGRRPSVELPRALKQWLDADHSRRIVVLFDETDKFFEADRRARYAVTEALRNLAAETHLRFKPVFAGLHNVQKLARDPNSPLAHLGQPLAIGPLLRGAERDEAEALARTPFAALGYRLEEGVAARILTFANYYPSLIQIVCQHLLREVRRQRGRQGPPWSVRLDDVERVLNQTEIRDAVRERFRITLELDKRYELIALLAAEESQDDSNALSRGMHVDDLRWMADVAWPAGFRAAAPEVFEALLEEMVGLGLLRQVDGVNFALRSSNLAHLLGSKDQLRVRRDAFCALPPPSEPDPLEFRRPELRKSPRKFSVFTARQEQEMLAEKNGIVLIAGLGVAHFTEWQNWLDTARKHAEDRGQALQMEQIGEHGGFTGFQYRLRALAQRDGTGLAVLLVPPDVAWTAQWVQHAAEVLGPKNSRQRFTRVIFVADVMRAWDWCVSSNSVLRQTLCRGEADCSVAVHEMTLGPWSKESLELWHDLEESATLVPDWLSNDLRLLLAVTGGWSALLRQLAEQPPVPNGHESAALTELLLARLARPYFDDLRTIPEALRTLQAIVAAEPLVQAEEELCLEHVQVVCENVDRDLLDRTLAWGTLLGALDRSARGPALNPVLRAMLPRFAALEPSDDA